MSNNLVEIAREYFQLKEIGNDIYQVVTESGKFDSIVIWGGNNSYFRYSNRMGGGPREFLKYIVGLPDNEIDVKEPTEADKLVAALRKTERVRMDTELSLQDVVGKPGYCTYIASRNISEETAAYYHLEIAGDNVHIPLYDEWNKRVGSIVRNAHAKSKGERYKTHLVGTNPKPCVWRFIDLANYRKLSTTIVLVEGAWSVMRIHQVLGDKLDIIPVATLGTALTDELFQYLSNKKIICILDDDTGGKKVEKQLIEWQKVNKEIEIYVPKIVKSDASAMVDDLSDDDLLTLFRKIYKQSNLLKLKT